MNIIADSPAGAKLAAWLAGQTAKSGPDKSGHEHEIISLVSFLIGVPKRIFENEYEPTQLEIHEKL